MSYVCFENNIFNIKMVRNVLQIHRNLALMFSEHHLHFNIQVCFDPNFPDLSTGVSCSHIGRKHFFPFSKFVSVPLCFNEFIGQVGRPQFFPATVVSSGGIAFGDLWMVVLNDIRR